MAFGAFLAEKDGGATKEPIREEEGISSGPIKSQVLCSWALGATIPAFQEKKLRLHLSPALIGRASDAPSSRVVPCAVTPFCSHTAIHCVN
jgi:hypothetical protein